MAARHDGSIFSKTSGLIRELGSRLRPKDAQPEKDNSAASDENVASSGGNPGGSHAPKVNGPKVSAGTGARVNATGETGRSKAHQARDRMRSKRQSRIRSLENGLSELDDQLGFASTAHRIRNRQQRRQDSHSRVIVAHPAREMARAILYAPDMDGHADPGEVVHVRFNEENPEQSTERQVLVVGRQGHTLLGTLLSTNAAHSDEPNWVAIGSDSFSHGKQSWVRVDRILEIPESGIRRDGSIMPARRFSIVARALRLRHGWS